MLLVACDGTERSSAAPASTSTSPTPVIAAPAVNGLAVEEETQAAAAVEAARVAAEAEAVRVAAAAEAARIAAEAEAARAAAAAAQRAAPRPRGGSASGTVPQPPAPSAGPAHSEWVRLVDKSCTFYPEWLQGQLPEKRFLLSFTIVFADGDTWGYSTYGFPSSTVSLVWANHNGVERQWPVTPETQNFDC
jgi:hypothetical protein